jgi:hypothetical protein
VTIDLAGGHMGGAARYRAELLGYLERRGLQDVKLIGSTRSLSPAWLAAREAAAPRHSRRVAVNNVGFLTPGGERRTLLANALHFLAPPEAARLEPWLRTAMARQAAVVHRAARRSDVLIAPCTAMAERVVTVLPDVAGRLAVRMHPVSPAPASQPGTGPLIFCPVLFAPYKHMDDRIAEWLTAVDDVLDDAVRLIVTASPGDVPASLAASTRLHFVGRLGIDRAHELSARCRAVYFPTSLESFGCPLAEARASGQPVIAVDSPQNREIAGPALFGYTPGDRESLLHATRSALSAQVAPEPEPFAPDAYFDWLLGTGKRGEGR